MFKNNLPEFRAEADKNAIVTRNAVRFTILTPYLIRLEYDPDQVFENRPSQVFWYREQPLPEYSINETESILEIETEGLVLNYEKDHEFAPATLSILIKANQVLWRYGDLNQMNLKGTYRTLDNTSGPVDLELGLNSISGWSLVDDTKNLVFTPEGWLTTREKSIAYKDLYFFGYGNKYKECIQDYQKIAGNVPMLPRWALGNWWSRYWAYSQDELLSLMDDFNKHKIPISVCIVDMDWHITNTGNKSSGWTGYTWNKELFPDPQTFINQLHLRGLCTALNLHPAEGIHPHEAAYEPFARRMGLDPASKQPISFDIADPKFTSAYFELLHRPLENMGVDFWWLDWQQGNKTSIPQLDPLYWLNHLHAAEQARDGSRRPFIFSRWPGLGGHRYPIGFSGDTYVSWESLDFLPYFTSTAANVAFGWWSHDIGGHMNGVEDAELYLRWVQYGVFSPILRLHSTKNPYHERRPWGYDAETEKHATQAMQLRHRLVPYLYTAAHLNEINGTPVILPMYFAHPNKPEAYQCSKQYYFGSELIAAPFTQPADVHTAFSRQVVWLPEGDWYDFFTGIPYKGDGWHAIYGRDADMPVFAKAGAIVSLSKDPLTNSVENPGELELRVFVGDNNTYELYEDDGKSLQYQQGKYSITRFSQLYSGSTTRVVIEPVMGSTEHLPDKRIYKLEIAGLSSPKSVKLLVENQPRLLEYVYNEAQGWLTLNPFECAYSVKVEVFIEAEKREVNEMALRTAGLARFISYTKLNTNVKSAFMQRVSEFMEKPASFFEMMHNFHPHQVLAIAELAFGKQDRRISYDVSEELQDLYKRFIR